MGLFWVCLSCAHSGQNTFSIVSPNFFFFSHHLYVFGVPAFLSGIFGLLGVKLVLLEFLWTFASQKSVGSFSEDLPTSICTVKSLILGFSPCENTIILFIKMILMDILTFFCGIHWVLNNNLSCSVLYRILFKVYALGKTFSFPWIVELTKHLKNPRNNPNPKPHKILLHQSNFCNWAKWSLTSF